MALCDLQEQDRSRDAVVLYSSVYGAVILYFLFPVWEWDQFIHAGPGKVGKVEKQSAKTVERGDTVRTNHWGHHCAFTEHIPSATFLHLLHSHPNEKSLAGNNSDEHEPWFKREFVAKPLLSKVLNSSPWYSARLLSKQRNPALGQLWHRSV